MDSKEILQLEADDASKKGINGKQVFFAKRINGKITHHKSEQQEDITLEKREKKQNKKEPLVIEIESPYIKIEPEKKEKSEIKEDKQKSKRKVISKKTKKRKKKRKLIKITILSLIIVGITVFALISPIFDVDKIEVKENEKIDSQTIISLSGIKEGTNIFKISKKQVANNLKENPYIENISTRKKLPNTIEITVQERKIAYQVKIINSYIYIDYQGNILEKSSQKEKVPIIEGLKTEQEKFLNDKKISKEDISHLRELIKIKENATNSGIWDKISKINIKEKKYTLEIKKENKIIHLGDATELTTKMMFLKVILEKEKENAGEIFLDGKINEGFNPYFREKK